MNVLLDEDVPIQALEILRRTLPGHTIEHVDTLRRRGTRWKGKKDLALLADAKTAGFDVFVTKNRKQLHDPAETKAIKRAGVHHVVFEQQPSLRGYGRAVGAVVAAMPEIIDALEVAGGQRLIRIPALKAARHEIVDPAIDPPRYWRR